MTSPTTAGTVLAVDPDPTHFTDPASLGDGTYCYRIDDTGAVESSNEVDVVVDNTAPNPVALSSPPANGAHVNADTSLTGTASDPNGIQSIQLQVFDGSVYVDTGAADTGSPYNLTFPVAGLVDGTTYTYRLKASDDAGNTGFSTPRTLFYDAVTNISVITGPPDGSAQHGTFAITSSNSDGAAPVTSSALASPHLANTYAARAGLSATSWASTAANDGVWDVVLSSQDTLLNPASTSAPITITIDNTPPSLSPTFPADNSWVTGILSVPYTVSDATTSVASVALQYDLVGGSVTWTNAATSGNPFQWNTAGVADGSYNLRVIATDTEGNQSTEPVSPATTTVRIDNTLPAIPVFSGLPANDATIGIGEMVIPYTGGTDTNLVNVQLQTQSQLQVAGNQWTARTTATSSPVRWTPQAADDCTCNFRLVATDQAGNVRVSLLRTNIKIDNFVPIAPSLFKIDRAITNGPPILTWTLSLSNDVVGYKLIRDAVHLQGNGGLLDPLATTYTDTDLPRDGSDDGAHGYSLTANDGGNDSPVKFVTFLLDSMAPTPPTAPTAKRRAGQRTVDLSWGESTDTQASSGASPTGVSRYVVRRAISPAVPTSATSGDAACDVAESVSTCVDTTAPEGHTYRYAVFAVDFAGNGSAGAAPAAVVIPDLTPPGVPAAFSARARGLTIAISWRLPAAPDLNKIVIVRNATRVPKSVADGKVVFTGKTAKASVKQLGGTTAYYRAFALDKAGNVSATAGVRIKQPVFKLFPENGSELRGTVRLTWKKPKKATYFNVQLYLGSKRVTQSWPKTGSFKIPKSKLKKGKTYTWYVWPGVGKKSAARYGRMIGKSTFTYLG